jgi:hypothetical protein
MYFASLQEPFCGPYMVEYLPPDTTIAALIRDGELDRTKVYVDCDADGNQERIYFVCPCGKHRRLVELNLDASWKAEDPEVPCWTFADKDGLADISPSVHWIDDIGCHFYLRDGMIQWC